MAFALSMLLALYMPCPFGLMGRRIVYNLPQVGFVRMKDILVVFPVSSSNWWAGVKSGRYPQPIKLSKRTTAWRVEDIRELIEQASNGELPC
jgi:predicted DNA-binding transcriptional regulator AlpA